MVRVHSCTCTRLVYIAGTTTASRNNHQCCHDHDLGETRPPVPRRPLPRETRPPVPRRPQPEETHEHSLEKHDHNCWHDRYLGEHTTIGASTTTASDKHTTRWAKLPTTSTRHDTFPVLTNSHRHSSAIPRSLRSCLRERTVVTQPGSFPSPHR
ncbi:hypothetical protein OTU49_015054 [Cherax quadricarinatus]|uniref:Uncharacterized protein n=1 Tax=Cherax quadricarinatus TaxID=27406 RepID=A0AAW0YGT1_CHEQU